MHRRKYEVESMDFFEWQSRYFAYNAAAHADMGWLPHFGQFSHLGQLHHVAISHCDSFGPVCQCHSFGRFVILTYLHQFDNLSYFD